MITRTIEAHCKICKTTISAKADFDCPQIWIDKLLPMITCNRCYDLQERRIKAEVQIFRSTKLLRLLKKGSDPREKVLTALRMALTDYARWLADMHRQGEFHYSEETFDMIVEQPERCGLILKKYRETVRDIYLNTPSAQDHLALA